MNSIRHNTGVEGFWNRIRTRFFFKVRARGAASLPTLTGAVLVSNHLSPTDGHLVRRAMKKERGNTLAKRVRFITLRRGEESNPELVQSVLDLTSRGRLVHIFAEGAIPRSVKMLKFSPVLNEILEKVDAPVIPVAIDRPWGTLVEVTDGKLEWKWPRRFPYPVTIRFGDALPSGTTAFRVRCAVQELQGRVVFDRTKPGDTLPDKFIRSARRFPFRFAMVDHTGKELNFIQALTGAIVIAKTLKPRLKGQKTVGILLPPSNAGNLVNAALSLLGKIAVNINYTASKDVYEYCKEKAGFETVITSRKFLEKLGWEESEEMLALEAVSKEMGMFRRLTTLITVCVLPAFLLQKFFCKPTDPYAPVSILFSSGSTGNPKGIVLSHFNILSNIQGFHQLLKFRPTDRMVGVLPFFHAFGYTATLWFPLASGQGAVYHPDPREGKAVAKLVREKLGSIIVCPPTFFQMYLRMCKPEDFANLRYAVAGAEKLKPALARLFEARFGLPLLEGYGTTELSPVVSVNTIDIGTGDDVEVGHKQGSIGHPIPGVAVKAVDLETGRDLEANESGLLCVKGPNVMLGYLDEPEKTAEVLVDGWYHTGDVGRIDEDGFIEITDRLSRFSKLGGEMVPHVKVESELQEEAPSARFAVTSLPDERKGEKLVVLHTELPDDLDASGLCERMRERGLQNLFIPKPDCFIEVEEVPLLASGKLDLRRVKEIAQETLAPEDKKSDDEKPED